MKTNSSLPSELRELILTNAQETSHIRSYGYNEAKKEMTIVWRNGKSHVYEGVGKSTWDGMVSAESKGKYVHSVVKAGGHKCRSI